MEETPDTKTGLLAKGGGLLRRRAVRNTLIGFAALFLLFGLVGYLWLPGFAKAKLEEVLSKEFARPVTVAGVDVSPYALKVTVRGFVISQGGGQGGGQGADPLLSFDSLTVRLSPLTFAKAIPVVSEVALVGPKIRLVQVSPGRFNISDLIDKWTAPPAEPVKKEDEKPAPEFSVANITVAGGAFVFEDQVRNATQAVTDIELGVPFITNAPGKVNSDVEPRFAAKVNGAPLALRGTARPFAPGRDAAFGIDIKDFDLMRLWAYAPPDLPVRLQSARLDAKLELSFSNGDKQQSKVRLSGQSTLREVSVLRPLPGGGVGATLESLRLDLAAAELGGVVRCALSAGALALSRQGEKQPFLGFAGLEVKGVELSQAERKAAVEAVLLDKPFGVVRRLPGGDIDLAATLAALSGPAKPGKPEAAKAQEPAPKGAAQAGAKAAVKADAASAAKADAKQAPKDKDAAKAGPWSWSVAHVGVSGGSLRYSDETLKNARPFSVEALTLALDGLSSAPGGSARLDFASRVNEQGSVGIKGNVQQTPLALDLDLNLTQVDLVGLQGFATENLNALLTRGDLNVKGHASLKGEAVLFKGDVALMDFSVLDKLNSSDLLRWRSLRLSGLDVGAGAGPLRLGVDEINLANFFARLLLTPEGRLNIKDIMKQPDGADHAASGQPAPGQPAQAAAPAAPAPAAPVAEAKAASTEPEKPAPQIRVGRIVLTSGSVNFTDRFIKPNYNANLTDLNGRIGALVAGKQSEIAIKGKVDRTAPLDISGTADPLGKELALDIKAVAKGIEMSNFSPYSGRYIGYAIEKGKLSVDVHYSVDKGQLKAENNVFLDQLTMGGKVESPEAMNVPINLVLALLKNSRGEIDINLPIQGSINDPQFSLGGIIVKVIFNLITKAITSPFSLIASMFGGGEELSYVTFEPGRADLSPAAQKQLETIGKALRERPALKLDLTGCSDPETEREGLKKAMLDTRVKAQKATELARQGKASGSLAEMTLTPEEYAKYLERVYKAADIKKPRNLIGLPKSLPPDQMEALLLASYNPGPDELQRLARQRAVAVHAWLADKGGVEQNRVFLLSDKVGQAPPKGAPAGGRVDFSLK